jgi:hypothetical protein
MSDAIKPGREGHPSIHIAVHMAQSTVKSPSSEVLGVMVIAGPVIDVTIDLFHVPFIQDAKSCWVPFGSLY